MSKLEPTVGPYDVTPLKRVSWGAIFGGTFISLAIMVLLGSLGIAIGATTIDPQTGDTPSARAFGIGAGIWWIGTSVLALFGGGWAAGRLAGPRRPLESTLHGVVTWSFTTTIAVALMTTAVGSMVSGAMRVLGAASSVVVQAATGANAQGRAQGGASVEDDVSDVNSRRASVDSSLASVHGLPDPNAIWQEVWNDAQRVVRENRRAQQPPLATTPNVDQDVGEVTDDVAGARQGEQAVDQEHQGLGKVEENLEQNVQQATGQGATMEDPQAALEALEARLSRLYRNARQNVRASDRDDVVDLLVARTNMSRDEARTLVNRWSSRFQGAWQPQQAQQTGKTDQTDSPAIRQPAAGSDVDPAAAAETAANVVAGAAWWTFFYFILTAIAGGVGGMLGSMRRRRDAAFDIRDTRTVTP